MFKLRTLAALTVCAAGVAAAASLPAGLLTQDDAQEGAEMPGMPPPPTEVHKWLLEGVGEWVGTIEAEMPGMPAMKEAATETVRAHGPYHTVSDFRCEFMGVQYMGIGVMGYDPVSKTMHGTWTDNMNPHTSFMKGKADLEKRTIDMVYDAPAPDGSGMIRHRNFVQHGKDAYSIHFFMGEEDEEMQFMKIEMKRKK